MSTARLLEPLLDGGVQSIKFFNGRLLSAEDLQQEQRAQRDARSLLGVAMGDGVVHGLEVSPAGALTSPVLRITPGLAVNREGDPLRLPAMIDLTLTAPSAADATPIATGGERAGLFHVCDAPAGGSFVTGKDLWVLTMLPARGTRGKAPVTGLGNSTGACNAKYVIDGVTFRLLRLTDRFLPTDFTGANEVKLRSLVAAKCFDSDSALAVIKNPFLPPTRARLIDDTLRGEGVIADCEVPLATFYWTAGNGFGFVDAWSVRRRLAQRDQGGVWSTFFSDRARSESEALALQFQAHIDDLVRAAPEAVIARSTFTHVPPVGVLPVTGTTTWRGFSVPGFFSGLTSRPDVDDIPEGPPAMRAYTVIEAARVQGLLEEALRHPPVSTTTDEVFRIYQVRENLQEVHRSGGNVQPYVIFARGAVPDHGDARYNVSHWSYATYG